MPGTGRLPSSVPGPNTGALRWEPSEGQGVADARRHGDGRRVLQRPSDRGREAGRLGSGQYARLTALPVAVRDLGMRTPFTESRGGASCHSRARASASFLTYAIVLCCRTPSRQLGVIRLFIVSSRHWQ